MKEALKLALEALEQLQGGCTDHDDGTVEAITVWCPEVIDAIKEALAQPEQEPFEYWNAVEGWVKIDEVRQHFDSVGCGTIYKTAGEDRAPLYTSPPQRQWVGLTDEEAQQAFQRHNCDISKDLAGILARAIEAKLKEKNT